MSKEEFLTSFDLIPVKEQITQFKGDVGVVYELLSPSSKTTVDN